MITETDPINTFFAAGAPSGSEILLAVIVILMGWIASIFVRRGVLTLTRRWKGITPNMAGVIARVAKYFVVLMSIGIALSFLGASVQPVLAAALIVGIVLFLALRGIADNFAAGVVIQTRHPMKPGDEIESGGFTGTVMELNGRSVVIRTRDGKTVHIPNSQVLSEPLQNNSEAGAIRSEVQVRVAGRGAAETAVRERIESAAGSVDAVHKRPAATALLIEAAPDVAIYKLKLWHHPLHSDVALDQTTRAILSAMSDPALRVSVAWPPPPPPLTKPLDP